MRTTEYSAETRKLLREISDELGVNLDPLELDPLELDPLNLEPITSNRTDWEDWETRINSGL